MKDTYTEKILKVTLCITLLICMVLFSLYASDCTPSIP